jgi:hypothetical protein
MKSFAFQASPFTFNQPEMFYAEFKENNEDGLMRGSGSFAAYGGRRASELPLRVRAGGEEKKGGAG